MARCTGFPGARRISSPPKASPTTFGAGPLPEPDHRLRRDDRRTAPRRRRGARREAVARRAGARGSLVPRSDEEPMESRRSPARRIQRLVGRSGLRHGCRSGGLCHRHRDARLDHLPFRSQRRRRHAAHLRPHQPLRRDGAQLDDGQDRTDVPIGRGLCAGVQRDLWSGRSRRLPSSTRRSPGTRTFRCQS